MSPTIRPAAVGDEHALAALSVMVQALHLAHDAAYFKPLAAPEVAAWFRAQLAEPAAWAWIAESSPGQGIAYVLVRRHERPATPFATARTWIEVEQLGVHPEWRRQGVGRALVHAVVAAAQAAGVPAIELTSWSFNAAAHAAFRRLGFPPASFALSAPLGPATLRNDAPPNHGLLLTTRPALRLHCEAASELGGRIVLRGHPLRAGNVCVRY